MANRRLCTPDLIHAPSYLAALRESYRLGDDPPYDPTVVVADIPAHIAEITRQGRIHVFADGSSAPLSPFTLFWFIEAERAFIGSLHLRHELANDYARLIAGHVRYGIRPSRRNQGLGTEMLLATFCPAKALGHGRLLVVCREANIASRRLIEKCGGMYERTVLDPHGEGPKRRYWIAV